MRKMRSLRKIFLITGFLAALFAFSGFIYLKKSGQLSPGPLSAAHPNKQPLNGYVSHADFETQCSHCHAPMHCITDSRCQDCHQEIARQRATANGLHGKLPGTNKCQNCHVEHRGPETTITELAFINVNHFKLANFSLARHTKDYDGENMNCESCHSQGVFI